MKFLAGAVLAFLIGTFGSGHEGAALLTPRPEAPVAPDERLERWTDEIDVASHRRLIPDPPSRRIAPDVIGLEWTTAAHRLFQAGLSIGERRTGARQPGWAAAAVVYRQSPPGGTLLPFGSDVDLLVAGC
jgi:PASTA domain